MLPQGAHTDWELSLLLSLDLFFASLFFFLCRGLDSRIISSSSKVGSQCRRPFCQDTQHNSHQAQQRLRNHFPLRKPLLSQWFLQPEEQPLLGIGTQITPTHVGDEARLHALLAHVAPDHARQVRRGLDVRQAGEAMLGIHCQQLGREKHW